MKNESSVVAAIKGNKGRKERQEKAAALATTLQSMVDNETALSALNLVIWKVIASAESLNGDTFWLEDSDYGSLHLSEDKATLYVTGFDMTFSFTRPHDVIGEVFADMQLTQEQLKTNVPLVLETLDALMVAHPANTLSQHDAIVELYTKMMSDADVKAEVAERMFTSRQHLAIVTTVNAIKRFIATNDVEIVNDGVTIKIVLGDRTVYCRYNASTIAEHISRANVSNRMSYEDAVRVCTAIDELLTKYGVIK